MASATSATTAQVIAIKKNEKYNANLTPERFRDNALYIIPYPEVKEMIAGHFAQIVDAIPALETDPEGAKKRTEALMEWARGGAKVFTPGA